MKLFRVVIGLAWAASASCGAIGQTTAPTSARPAQAGASQTQPIQRANFILTMDAEFRKIDANKNGILSRKEIEDAEKATSMQVAWRRNVAMFRALDKDKNGQLSAAEFSGLPMTIAQPNAAQNLAQVDANRDGQATLIEYRAGKLVNFDRMDADKDGVVSPAEMRAAGLIK